jgi:O-acetyl-ADP-ribose deacetylase (regulator of RNase III)
VYGYPKAEACEVAVAAVAEWLASNELPESVIFCCFGADDTDLYRARVGAQGPAAARHPGEER